MNETTTGFLLTRQWLGGPQGLTLVYWFTTDTGPVRVIVSRQEAVFFVPRQQAEAAERALRSNRNWRQAEVRLKTFDQELVNAYYFRDQRRLREAADSLRRVGIEPSEADIRPADRYLMERFLAGPVAIAGAVHTRPAFREFCDPRMRPAEYQPHFRVVSLDIETSPQADALYSVALYCGDTARVFMVGAGQDEDALCFLPDERTLLAELQAWFRRHDPDIIIGWNVVGFDLRVLHEVGLRLGVALALGRDGAAVQWRASGSEDGRHFALVPGRVVLDGIDTLKAATYRFESFALEHVSRQILGRGKLIDDARGRAGQIEQMYRHDPKALAAYNLEDCRLVWELFRATDLIDFAVERARLTGLDMDRIGGSVAAFDNLYLPRLHRHGYVAPVPGPGVAGVASPGGYVMNSRPGLFRHVLVLDFKSLYPSIIRTFRIDPMGLVEGLRSALVDGVRGPEGASLILPGYRGGQFSASTHILPQIIEDLWIARERARRDGHKPLAQAIKIIMNSFYGVLGSPGCRFFDPRLASSITLRGQDIIIKSRELIEKQGYAVIYGDTDSLFVWLNHDCGDSEADRIGMRLAVWLNDWWREHLAKEHGIESFLEIEYEAHYQRFLMPTVRGSSQGSKKRYAGMLREPDGSGGVHERLVFKGLESVRTDWTPLAREVQRELYSRVFRDQPIDEYVRTVVEEIRAGRRDPQLVYRKRLRRRLAEYQHNIPPHVQAARKADQRRARDGLPSRYQNGGWIEYYITTAGPEPVELVSAPLDYDHYLSRQIAPVVDGIALFLDTSFDEIFQRQLGLFARR